MGNGEKSQRWCSFCSTPANSHERLLLEWLQSVLPAQDRVIHHREIGGVKTSWEKKPFTETRRIVCHECNTGWMSRLEHFAKPILTPAVGRQGLPCQLSICVNSGLPRSGQ
jgi:hypothetical protein